MRLFSLKRCMMDEQRVRRVVKLISDYCGRIQELRQRRIGKMSSLEFWNALVATNKAIKTTDDPNAKSEKIGLKHVWFNPSVFRSEIGALSALMDALQSLLDADVLAEIKAEGYDANRIRLLVEKGAKMAEQAKAFIGAWENAYGRLLTGQPVKSDELSALEYKIAGMVHGLEDAIVKQQAPAVARVTQNPAYTRRGFLSMFAKRAAAAIVLAGASSIMTATGTKAAYGQDIAQKADEITESEITDMMKKDTVEEILKGANVEYVQRVGNDTNFDALVYQKNLKPEERKPVLVFFYHNRDPPSAKGKGSAHRDAIIFISLAKMFHNRIKFVGYNADVRQETNADWFNKMGLLGIPSISMYSTFDVLKGETVEKNSGQIKQIDVIRGGPLEDKFIAPRTRNNANYWIPTNLFMKQSIDKDNKVYRYNNTGEIKVVGESILLAKE